MATPQGPTVEAVFKGHFGSRHEDWRVMGQDVMS